MTTNIRVYRPVGTVAALSTDASDYIGAPHKAEEKFHK
jgi:hypothetical protein